MTLPAAPATNEVADHPDTSRGWARLGQYIGLVPSIALFGLFLGAPLLLVVLYSLWTVVDYQVVKDWTLDNFQYLLGTDAYLKVALRTLAITLASTVIAICAAFPLVYWLSRYVRPSLQRPLLVLVILPFGTSYLLRVYAWLAILGDKGMINQILHALGLTHHPVHLLYNSPAVVAVLVYLYLPFAILTLFTSLERFDWNQMKAAQDLGARPTRAVISVLLPQMRAGIVTATIFVFIPILGEYLTPQLVGGTNGSMIGNTMVNFFQSSQYTRGAALGLLIMTVVVVLLIPARRHLDVGGVVNGR